MNARLIPTIITILLIIFLIPISLKAQDMIANIDQPVTTEFGVYKPYKVDVTPGCLPYIVEPDFKNVVNFGDFTFTATEESLLAEHYFVVSRRRYGSYTGYREIYDIYNECRDHNIPIFVTTDAMLHTFHLCFDYILETIEQQKFIDDLNQLLTNLINTSYDQFNSATNAAIVEVLTRNLDFLVTAKVLLDSSYTPPSYNGKYLEELALIEACKGFFPSPTFGYAEDYSQYIVRGHYTKTIPLRHYFRSMMWLSRMTFAADPKYGLAEPNRSATRSAILLIQAIQNSIVNDAPAIEIWQQIYSPTVFFVGKSDDINIYQYEAIIQQVYGDDFINLPVDSFTDENLLDSFLNEAIKLPGPKIVSLSQPQGFRFMGQRFIPDSYIFNELTYDRLSSERYFPKGLDAMVVLGSSRAGQILAEMGEFAAYPDYATRLNQLSDEFKSYDDKVWAQNIYWNWLYSLMPLLFTKGAGYPLFMQKPAWMDKELYAALSSWGELRHDTILYSKPTGSEIGLPLNAIQQQGYVEPNPYLYARLASLAEFLITGLDNRNLLFTDFETHLQDLAGLLVNLKIISEKELTNRSLTSDEYLLINEIGSAIESIVEFDKGYESTGPTPDTDDEMPVIADVHTATDGFTTNCLEEGVGYPFCIYVICNVAGQLKITKGGCYSYYEFTLPANNRLTDEAWRDMLQKDDEPDMPYWIESFTDRDDPWLNYQPGFHYWETFYTLSLTVAVTPDSPKIGDVVEISISPDNYGTFYDIPTIAATTADSQIYLISDIQQSGNSYIASWNTTGLPEGQVWLEISAIYNDWASNSVHYRTGFFLTEVTDIGNRDNNYIPNNFLLEQNYPNPFNSSTIISYRLPQAGKVAITIYDIVGNQVKTLLRGHQNHGIHHITWDGKNDLGRKVCSGVYFYKLETENFTQVKKMILLF